MPVLVRCQVTRAWVISAYVLAFALLGCGSEPSPTTEPAGVGAEQCQAGSVCTCGTMPGTKVCDPASQALVMCDCSRASAGSPAAAGAAGVSVSGAAGQRSVAGTGASGTGVAGTSVAGVGAAGMGAAGMGAAGMAMVPAGAGGAVAAGNGGAPAAGSGGSMQAGAGGAVAASGGFPKTDPVDIKHKGQYTVKTYTEGLQERAYSSSMMYYPEGAQPPFAAIAFTPGFTATKESYTVYGNLLASHGFVALLTTPTSTSDQPPARGTDLVAAVARIVAENSREGSPLKGKIATDRICVTGHSMGGGGSLFGASELGKKIRCAVPLQPWQPGGSFRMIQVPTLFIGAQNDTIASVSGNASPHYASIPDTTEKILAVFKGADHFLSTNSTTDWTTQAAYIVPFLKLFLEDDERYRPYLYGDMRVADVLSRYEHSKN